MGKTQEVLTKMNVAAANLAAELAAEKIKEISELAAAAFYDDYNPNYYNRSYGFYNAGQPVVKTISGPGTAEGGVVLSAGNIGGHYNQSPETVFEWDFIGGEHGGINKVSQVTSPSPMDTIDNDVNSQRGQLQQMCSQEAMSIVQAQYGAELRNAIIEDVKSQGVK